MSETYDAVYAAALSRIGNCNAYQAVYDAAFRQLDPGNLVGQCSQAIQQITDEHTRPSVLFRPTLTLDGNYWVALLGANLQEGVVGTGRSPDEAMRDFDASWTKQRPAMIPVGR